MAEPSGPRAFLAELRRRRVIRVVVVYAVVAWVVIQVADTVVPRLDLPDWAVTLIIVVALLGLPLAIVLAWAFDITPAGVRRTPPQRRKSGGAARPGDAGRLSHSRGLGYVGTGFLVALVGLGLASHYLGRDEPERDAGDAALDRAIAVLPFVDLSPGGDQQHFVDGMTEDILTRLSTISDLHVISRTSVMQYRGTTKNLRQIGEELGVGRALEGSVRRADDRVRIVVQLMDARSDRQLWAETYDRELTDIFQVQSEIAERIATALRLRLTPEARDRLAYAGTWNIEAYDLYLKGREYFNRSFESPQEFWDNVSAAIAFFRRALEADSAYAPAYAGLSEAFRHAVGLPAAARRDSAQVYARRAIALAPDLPDGYVQLARVLPEADREAALDHLRRAVALEPNHADAIATMAHLYQYAGRLVEALAGFRHAAALDPGFADHARSVAWIYRALGDPDAAEEWIDRTHAAVPHPARHQNELAWIDLDRGDLASVAERVSAILEYEPDGPIAQFNAVDLYITLGDDDAARRLRERAAPHDHVLFSGEFPELVARHFVMLALLDRRTGRDDEADAWLRRAEETARQALERAGPSAGRLATLARVLAHQGDVDGAVRLLTEAVDRGWREYYTIRHRPDFAPLEGNPRFEALMVRVREDVDAMRARARREIG
jgi:TolB-like protein/Tfp pilus assembly protein PilF